MCIIHRYKIIMIFKVDLIITQNKKKIYINFCIVINKLNNINSTHFIVAIKRNEQKK